MNNHVPPRIHVLAKPTGAICNLACSYCFFLDKELLYPGSPFRMTDEMLETYIRQLIAAHRTPQVTVGWQGGEPTLMGVEFYRRAIELQHKYRKPGMTRMQDMHYENTMQTNGTLLDDEWCAFSAWGYWPQKTWTCRRRSPRPAAIPPAPAAAGAKSSSALAASRQPMAPNRADYAHDCVPTRLDHGRVWWRCLSKLDRFGWLGDHITDAQPNQSYWTVFYREEKAFRDDLDALYEKTHREYK
jgi:hypothetical protein